MFDALAYGLYLAIGAVAVQNIRDGQSSRRSTLILAGLVSACIAAPDIALATEVETWVCLVAELALLATIGVASSSLQTIGTLKSIRTWHWPHFPGHSH